MSVEWKVTQICLAKSTERDESDYFASDTCMVIRVEASDCSVPPSELEVGDVLRLAELKGGSDDS